MGNKTISAKFKPRARLLLQLGDQLIKNESIALVELVKNSYDADATRADIIMEDPESNDCTLIIEDDGYGMSLDTVLNVWLEPGSDYKSKKIKNLEFSPRFKRLPIGEKGIGRFGVHKLGDVIEMTTKAQGSKEVHVIIDWSLFYRYDYLEDVPIQVIEREVPEYFKNGETGTSITIRKLREKWNRGIAREVKRSITALVSPFETHDSFKPTFNIIDKPEWFEGLLEWDEIKDYSLYNFKAKISDNKIIEFEYRFTPWASMPKVSKRKIDGSNELIKSHSNIQKEIEFIDSSRNIEIGDVVFEGYIFDRDPYILKMGVSDKKGFKNYLDGNGGIRVFRDKLRVYDYGEPENDWLELDYKRFQNPFRSFSNNQILGAVYLDRKFSINLIEKTNREGFVENIAYKKLKFSLEHIVKLVEIIRESDKRRLKNIYGPTPKSEPVMSLLIEAKEYAESKVEPLTVKKQIVKYLNKIESDYKRVNENLLKAAGAGLSMSVVVHEVEKIIAEIMQVLKTEDSNSRLLKLVKHLSSLIDGYAEIIRRSKQSSENVIEVIDQAIFNTEYRLKAHNIEIIRQYRNYSGETNIKLTKSLIIGSLMNLIDNSIYWLNKARSSNLNLKQKIFIDLIEDRSYINLIISDNGTGFLIPTEDIIEPFVSAKPGGVGLGLHITNEIMLAQNGRLIFPDYGDFELPSEFKSGATIVLAFKK